MRGGTASDTASLWQAALDHHEAGRLLAAEQLYRQILRQTPRHAPALHRLGLLAFQAGNLGIAEFLIGQAIAEADGDPLYHFHLGTVLQQAGKIDGAMLAYRRALQRQPDHVESHVNLGIAHAFAGGALPAIQSFQRALALSPELPQAWSNLGIARGRLRQAAALTDFRRALRCRPQSAATWFDLGAALHDQGAPTEATGLLIVALQLQPDFLPAQYRLGLARRDLGDLDDAQRHLRRAARQAPQDPDLWLNLGTIWWRQSLLADAIGGFRRALVLSPGFALALNNLGAALADQGRLDPAMAAFHHALRADPLAADVALNLAVTQSYRPGVTLSDLQRLAGDWFQGHAAALTPRVWPRAVRQRQPRIGFISADFRLHPVGRLAAPVIEALAQAGHDLTCFDNGDPDDAVTERLRRAAGAWHKVAALSDDSLAALIGDRRIDILIDLSGHSAGNRLLALARRPAALQVTWLGWPATTGLPAIDILLADPLQVPPASEGRYAEKIVRLPRCWAPYEAPIDDPAPGEPPCLGRRHVTFGSFNALKKINPEVIGVWCSILRSLPSSRLVVKAAALRCPETCRLLLAMVDAEGIDAGRILLKGPTTLTEHRAQMRQVDIALDSFPFCGGITTLESIWSGLPVITLPGETFASRTSAGYLSQMRLAGCIAGNEADYVAKALALAQDTDRLSALRRSLRQRMQTSGLCDIPGFAQDFAQLLTDCWRQQPSSESP